MLTKVKIEIWRIGGLFLCVTPATKKQKDENKRPREGDQRERETERERVLHRDTKIRTRHRVTAEQRDIESRKRVKGSSPLLRPDCGGGKRHLRRFWVMEVSGHDGGVLVVFSSHGF